MLEILLIRLFHSIRVYEIPSEPPRGVDRLALTEGVKRRCSKWRIFTTGETSHSNNYDNTTKNPNIFSDRYHSLDIVSYRSIGYCWHSYTEKLRTSQLGDTALQKPRIDTRKKQEFQFNFQSSSFPIMIAYDSSTQLFSSVDIGLAPVLALPLQYCPTTLSTVELLHSPGLKSPALVWNDRSFGFGQLRPFFQLRLRLRPKYAEVWPKFFVF